ncbi:unnamed protein product, partial [Mesorhabditis spiculigera]
MALPRLEDDPTVRDAVHPVQDDQGLQAFAEKVCRGHGAEPYRMQGSQFGHLIRKNPTPLAARRRREALMKGWAATPLHNMLSAKELAIDRVMHGFAGNGRYRMYRDELDYECVDDGVPNAYKQLLDPPRSFYP